MKKNILKSCVRLTKKLGVPVSENVGEIVVNEKKEYHNCEMIFSFYYENEKSDFKVDSKQPYKIYTTIKEVAILNEALELFQSEGFKDNYLQYTAVVDGSNKYPMFAGDYIEAVQLGRALQALANDEDSLVQLSEYCLETAPTYEDDFRINKKIESIIIDGQRRAIEDFEDLESYILELKETKKALFN